MKTILDPIAQRIFAGFFGAAIFGLSILFGISLINNNTVKADNPSTVNSTGKIQMQVNGFELNNKPAFHILVWDSETGKSKMYNFDGVDKFFVSKYQIPASPLY